MIERIKFRLFLRLLKWFCDETDQWDLFQIKSKGTIWYVNISLKPLDGCSESAYRKMNKPKGFFEKMIVCSDDGCHKGS